MSSHFLAQSLLLCLLVYADFTYSKVHYIRPSLDSPCPQNASSCLTLSQFAANSSHNETDISLLFLPGNHTLSRELLLAHGHNFSMSKYEKDNERVFVQCISQLGRFNISEATSVSIKCLHFIGCGSNRVSQVIRLTIADSIFQDVEDNSTVLELNRVYIANIETSQFLFNTLEYYIFTIKYYKGSYREDVLDYVYHHRNRPSGVFYIVFSNVSIISSWFMYNKADIGGALVAHNSSVQIDRSTLSYNTANSGGAMVTSASTIDIDNCTFIGNTVHNSGGVMVTYNDKFTIWNTSFIQNNAYFGGVMSTFGNSSVTMNNCNCTSNDASHGGVMLTWQNSLLNISNSTFTSNSAKLSGGVMAVLDNSSFTLSNCTFTYNNAIDAGGVILIQHNSTFNISNSAFTSNSAWYGGVMLTWDNSSFTLSNCTFTYNNAIDAGGVILIQHNSTFNISNSAFTSNSALYGGVMTALDNSSVTLSNCTFTYNNAINGSGGVIVVQDNSSVNISNSTFTSNSAWYGGVMITWNDSSLIISDSTFSYNQANAGSAIFVDSLIVVSHSTFTSSNATADAVIRANFNSVVYFSNSTFINNRAISHFTTSIILCSGKLLNIDSCNFSFNAVHYGGIISLFQCSIHIVNCIFDHNVGTLFDIFNSNLNLSGDSQFENSNKALITDDGFSEGGVITSYQSTVVFTRDSKIYISSNQARDGGAILAIESTIIMYGETTIANNNMTAIANSSGGGISLKLSRLEIKGNCTLFNNSAMRGGGIHATSSTISVYQPATLKIINNNAKLGGGMYLEVNSKLYVLKEYYNDNDKAYLNFTDNHAKYGGAMYVDDTNSITCSAGSECFIQTLRLYGLAVHNNSTVNIFFSGNTATTQGSNLFGGLLDRCIPSQYAELLFSNETIHYSGVTYLQNISNITQLDSISSQPVRVCFCNSEHKPDCSYQLPNIAVKKGEIFNVSVVAVDQVNNTVDANISSSVSSIKGDFGEGQKIQRVERNCSDLTYNVYSPHNSETINLFADGPCGSAALSTSHITIQFTDCTCPVGFQPLSNSKAATRCECICDSILSPFITHCDYATSSVIRVGTNSWITYINDTDPPGYVKFRYCPFDYCKHSKDNISINFNLPNGADAQCSYNRTGVLCGSCRGNFSLSLATSRCLPCHRYWPAVCILILLAAILAGILLVTALLALNMTVSVGLINVFIFYADIMSAGSAVFFPSSKPSFPSVFVAWLNLDIGIDVCFIDGLDAYIKTWLQLAFPAYIISLVVMVIIVSECSPKFAGLIGKKDPVSTLATLILLSYAKLLSVIITALSYATLDYPDGTQEIVWLPDGNVKYFQGKHIPLVLVAVLIIIIGLPYTILLLLWQWIVRAPRWKIFKWTRNTKLNVFIATYHVPHNSKYRYWTGLLLLVRVIFYVTTSVTESSAPQTLPISSVLLIGGLFLFKGVTGRRVYRKSLVDVVDTVLNYNLLALAVITLYDFKQNTTKQTVVAYTSTITTLIIFIGSICYHVILLTKKKELLEECNEPLLSPVEPAKAEVTYSVIDLPTPDQDPLLDSDRDRISEHHRIVTPPYTDD